jgi:hypothetical protein
MPEPRRTGRPPIADDDPSTSVHVRLPSRQYDEVYRQAQLERVSIPEIIRRSLDPSRRSRDDD